MSDQVNDRSISRRTALTGLSAGAFGIAIGSAISRDAAAQAADVDMASHPIVGAWNATTPVGPAPGIFFPNGIALMTPQVTQAGPNGVTFVTGQIGVWEQGADRLAEPLFKKAINEHVDLRKG